MTVDLQFDERLLDVISDRLSKYDQVIAPLVQGGFSKSIFDYRNKVWPSHAKRRIDTGSRRPSIGSKWFFRVDVPKVDASVRRVEDAGGRMHSTSKAGVLLEEGGVVRPKRSRYLAIPTKSKQVRTAKGRVKQRFRGGPGRHWYQFRGFVGLGGIPENWNTFTNRNKRGQLYIYRKIGKGKKTKVEALFRLERSASHTPKLQFEIGTDAYMPIVARNVQKKIDDGIRRAFAPPVGSRRR